MANTRFDTELRLALNPGAYSKTRQGLESISQSLGRMRREVLGFVTGFASLRGVQELSRVADQANTLRAKLRLVTDGQASFNEASEQTFAIAQRTRTPLAAIVEAFDRLVLPMRELKREQGDTLALTEILAQGFALEGSSAEEAAGKIERFAMALTQGEVNAAALNSIAIESPALMQALAAGLNVPIMKLRELAKEGKLTAQVVVDALLSQKDTLAAQYAELPQTVAGALQRVKNQFLVTMGEIDQASGASQAVAAGLNGTAANMRLIFDGVGVAGLGLAVVLAARLVPALIAATFAKVRLALAARSVAAELGITAGAALTVTRAFSSLRLAFLSLLQLGAAFFAGFKLGEYLRDNFKVARDAGYILVGELMVAWERIKQGFRSIGPSIVVAFSAMADKILVIAADLIDKLGGSLAKLPDRFGGAIGRQLQGFARQLRTGVGEGAGKEALADLDQIGAEANANIQRIRDEMAELIAQPMGGEQAPATAGPAGGGGGGGGLPATTLESFKAQVKRIEAELEASFARRQITEQQYLEAKLDLELISLDREIAETEKKRAKAFGDEQLALEHHVEELKAKRVAAEAAALTEIQEKRARALEEQAEKIGERLRRREERIARDRELGRIGEVDARTQTGDARREARANLDQVIAAAEKLEGTIGAETVEKLKAIRDGIVELKSPLQEVADQIKTGMTDRLADAFETLINGTKSATEAVEAFGHAMLAMIQRILAERLASELVASFFPTGKKDDGIVRRAAGGFVSGPGGPRDDRIPALLSNGEYVLQASAVRRYGRHFLDALNGGALPRIRSPLPAFAGGGMAGEGGFAREMGGGVEVNITNQAPGVELVQQRRRDGRREIVDVVVREVVRDITDGGAVAGAISRTFGTKRSGRAT
jgi:tape measure domain-containing protein